MNIDSNLRAAMVAGVTRWGCVSPELVVIAHCVDQVAGRWMVEGTDRLEFLDALSDVCPGEHMDLEGALAEHDSRPLLVAVWAGGVAFERFEAAGVV